jgi:hypothetical protein
VITFTVHLNAGGFALLALATALAAFPFWVLKDAKKNGEEWNYVDMVFTYIFVIIAGLFTACGLALLFNP